MYIHVCLYICIICVYILCIYIYIYVYSVYYIYIYIYPPDSVRRLIVEALEHLRRGGCYTMIRHTVICQHQYQHQYQLQIYIYIYIYIHTPISLSLYIYIYIYMYIFLCFDIVNMIYSVLHFKGWHSHAHRAFTGKSESSNLSRDNLSSEIGRSVHPRSGCQVHATDSITLMLCQSVCEKMRIHADSSQGLFREAIKMFISIRLHKVV